MTPHCRREGCTEPVAYHREANELHDDVVLVPNKWCSPQCASRGWRDQYKLDHGVSYDTERGRDARAYDNSFTMTVE